MHPKFLPNPWLPLLAIGLALCAAANTATAQATRPATQPAFAFSEDFESGKLDPALWTQDITGGNLIAVQSDRAAHGKFALHVQCPAASQRTWAFISTANLPTALRTHLFGRVYMYVTPKPPARHMILLMAGTPGFPRNKFEEVATTNEQWQLTYVDLQPNGDREDYHLGGGDVPVGKWFCLEWEFNDHPSHATIWVDGKQVYETDFKSARTGTSTDLIGSFTNFALGFRLWGAAPEPFDLYFDDLALDTKRIGPLPTEH